ncbi:MAG TPA: endonuclease/exonuclease/phosphatase family protein [Ktedonobacteraceae bacterium]|jgi:endonuclease/exonuclease/phosphatase family metal-dependent hydrolase|nr:endonuclease/exonuclease/phosphatase family protein [Ktedonobacteraceae bacterium]
MTRIVSYNILAGGYRARNSKHGERRTSELVNIIRSADPDIVGIIEAINPERNTHPNVVEEVADILGMQYVPGSTGQLSSDYRSALLTRLPIVHTHVHERPGIITKPLLEVCVEEADGQQLTAFVTHMSSAFSRGRGGGSLRLREAQEIVRILEPLRQQQKPHFLMGDFNSLAPGDPFQAHRLVRYVSRIDRLASTYVSAEGNPHLNSVVPKKLRFLNPLLRVIPNHALLSAAFDWAAGLYVPRASIGYFKQVGYVDCYRYKYPRGYGFTCPAADPAGRIDYIFASPDLVERLEDCHEIVVGKGTAGRDASDHLAVTATFGVKVQQTLSEIEVGGAAQR